MLNTEVGATLTSGYPPDRHMLRDLLLSLEFDGGQRCIGREPVTPEICADGGGVRVGVIAALVDILGGGLAIKAAYPNSIATTTLSIYTAERVESGTITARGSVIRTGLNVVVVDVDIFAEATARAEPIRSIGSAMMAFLRLPHRKESIEAKDDSAKVVLFGLEDSGLSRPLIDELGIRMLDQGKGVAEVYMSSYVRNSFGALHGGVIAVVADLVGEQVAHAATGRLLETRDLTIHYLSQGRVGPFRTRAKVICSSPDRTLTRVEVVDSGASNRLVAVAMNASA